MYLIPIAWLYVALMMAVAEATNTTGSVLGGVITFVLYGLGPVALVIYLMGAPARRKKIRAREHAERLAHHAAVATSAVSTGDASIGQPDAGGESPAATEGHTVAPVRKEP
jgi:hypothetical protein